MPLTVEQKLTKARAFLLRDFPFFGSLAMQLQVVEDRHKAMGTASTDGNSVFYDPDFINESTMPEVQFVMAHEALHCAHFHHTRRMERDPRKWNIACDYAINPLLVARGLEMPPKGLLNDDFKGDSAEKIFSTLPQTTDRPQSGDASEDGAGDDGESGDSGPQIDPGACGGVIDAPSHCPNTENAADGDSGGASSGAPVSDDVDMDASGPTAQDIEDQERKWKRAVADAANVERKTAGSLPGDIAEMIDSFLEPKRDWRDELRDLLHRITKDDYSWRRPSRRFITHGMYLPSLHSESAGHVAIAVDTSASISSTMLKQFGGEIHSILEDVEPSQVTIIYCDTRITDVQQYDELDAIDEWKHTCKGRGGTRVMPVFDWIDEQDDTPEALVYLSDLEVGDFPQYEPDYPVIWACPKEGHEAPIGTTIYVND